MHTQGRSHHRQSKRYSTTPGGALRQKLVIVGDGACGKTCLLQRLTAGTFDADAYVPTVFETCIADLSLRDGRRVELALWDTAGQEEYDRLRPLSYPDSDVVLIAFAVSQPDSLENIYDKWNAEVRHFCPDLPVLLVGLKIDLRRDERIVRRLWEDAGKRPTQTEDGVSAAKEIGCDAYVECSSKTGEGVKAVFETACMAALKKVQKRPHSCTIL